MIQAEAVTTETQKIVNEVLVRVDALAAKLGTTAEALWPSLVEQARLKAIGALIGLAVMAFVSVALFVQTKGKAMSKPDKYGCTDPTWAFAVRILSGFGIVAALVLFAALASEILSGIFVPEAAAIQSLLGR